MKLFLEKMAWSAVLGLVLVVSGLRVHAQQVNGSYWWIDGEGLASPNQGVFSPVQGLVPDSPGASCTFTANPGEGLRVFKWMRWNGSGNSSDTSNYLELPAYGDDNPLIWAYDAACGSPVTLALVTTWIKYRLTYLGGGTTEQLFTNQVTIAECETARTGYSFSGSWTNALGNAFVSGEQTDGSAFGIVNHDDNAVVTLYPKWTANRCTIAYELEGGAHGASHPGTAEYDQEIVVSDPLRTGYGLKEWTITPKPSESGSRIVRGNGETRFTNLFTEDGTKVTLTAVWTNCKYRVDFNHWGAESGPNPMIVTYDEAYMPIIIPKKSGSTFLGYYTAATDGDLLWDAEGQPVREKWDIASDQMVHAHWEAETYYLKYDANGGTGEISSQLITNGVSVTLSDGSGLSFSGCTLLGWARDSKAASPEFALGATRTFNEATTLYAVWQVSYFLSFDGHGATSGKMPVEMFVRGEEKPLPANTFEKTGYTFGGWAESAERADALVKKYEDRQLVKDVSDIPGSTNTLFAVWNTNTYYVAFNKGSGSGEPMETMEFVYDQTQRLAKCTFAPPHELYGFAGWQDGITGELIPDEAVVSNLCAEANATNTLVAKWALSLSDFSKSMHCDTLDWKLRERGLPDWETNVVAGCGYGTDSCVSQAAGGWNTKDWLEAEVKTNGVLTFAYKWNKSEESSSTSLKLAIGSTVKKDGTDFADADREKSVEALTPGEWVVTNIIIQLVAEQPSLLIHLAVDMGNAGDSICIDQMKWEPEGGFPDLPVTTNAVPVAVTGLVYDGTEKTGVKPGIGYTLVGNAATDAGEYEATATPLEGYVWEGGFAGSTNIAWSIAKGTKDVSGVTFTDATFEYDGKPHSFGVVGEIPDGVEVVYEGETNRTEVGTNVVTASFRVTDAKNWNEIGTKLTAKLIVNPQDVPPVPPEPVITNRVPVAVTGLVYDGTAKVGVVKGGDYTLVGDVATNAGAYVATATLPEKGYVWEGGSSAPTNIAWSIAKGTKDVSGVTFPDAEFEYDGAQHSFGVVGTVPDGVEVVYSGETVRTEVGTNVVTASFLVTDTSNWNEIADTLTATLVVREKDDPQPIYPPGVIDNELRPGGSIGTFSAQSAATYTGWLRDISTSNIVGTLTVKTTAAKAGKPCKTTVTVTPIGGKKKTYKSKVDMSTDFAMDEFGIVYGSLAAVGTFRDAILFPKPVAVEAAKDFSKSKDKDEKALTGNYPVGCYTVSLRTSSGFDCLSVTVAKKTGKAKVKGFLDDGTKISVSSQGVLGQRFAVPVLVQKKNAAKKLVSFGLVLWVDPISREASVSGLQGDRWLAGECAVGELDQPDVGEYRLGFELPTYRPYLAKVDGFDVLPTGYWVMGNKLDAGKTVGSLKVDKQTGAVFVKYEPESQVPANLAKLKLKYTQKTGIVGGSFKLYYLSDDSLKTDSVTISGIMVRGVLQGNAVVKVNKKKEHFLVWSEIVVSP